jgi:hypothetical protein
VIEGRAVGNMRERRYRSAAKMGGNIRGCKKYEGLKVKLQKI